MSCRTTLSAPVAAMPSETRIIDAQAREDVFFGPGTQLVEEAKPEAIGLTLQDEIDRLPS